MQQNARARDRIPSILYQRANSSKGHPIAPDAPEDFMADSEKKCAHPACNCSVGKDEKYCSQYCKDAGSAAEISCNCAHRGCAIGAAGPTMTAR